jgi:hypothetical protein
MTESADMLAFQYGGQPVIFGTIALLLFFNELIADSAYE